MIPPETVRTVYRYEVPVDDRWHTFELTGPILHVACRQPTRVEFWTLAGAEPKAERTFRVYGTGHHLDAEANQYVRSAIAPGDRLVWHLFESVAAISGGGFTSEVIDAEVIDES